MVRDVADRSRDSEAQAHRFSSAFLFSVTVCENLLHDRVGCRRLPPEMAKLGRDAGRRKCMAL